MSSSTKQFINFCMHTDIMTTTPI